MLDSIYIHNSYSVSNLVYHFVGQTKYRRIVITETVDESLKQIYEEIELRYDWITFLEIDADQDYVHFLVQSTPDYSPTKIITTIKSITVKRIFAEHPEVKKQFWGGNFWSDGFNVRSLVHNVSVQAIKEYVKIKVNKIPMKNYY